MLQKTGGTEEILTGEEERKYTETKCKRGGVRERRKELRR